MSSPLGEERIVIRPDASTFRAELQAQIATAMRGVERQIAQAQSQLRRTATVAAATTPSGIILPPGVRAATTQQTQATDGLRTSTEKLGNTTQATREQLLGLSNTQRRVAGVTQDMKRSIATAETAVGRYSRGLVASTVASTGFFRAVSFASGAFLLGATIGATIAAAVNEFTQMTQVGAQTVQLIRSTGGAANVTAKQVDTLSLSVLKLTGIDDELVKQGANVLLTFRNVRNEVGRGNDIFNRAVRAAADIAAVFRTDLRGSALQLGKALQDPERGVTALRRSGISLSQGQRDLIKALVRSGAVLTAQKVILGEVERQVGGAAEAIGRTLPGRLRIMREEALNSLGALVKRLSESKTAADLVAGAAQGVSEAWGAVRATLAAIGPSLVGIAQGFGKVTRAVGGVAAILAAAAAYKAVTAAAGLATRATALYATASASAARVALADAQANGLATVALEERAAAELTAARAAQRTLTTMTALSAIFAVGAAASGQWVIALAAGGFALLGIAAKARAAIVALRAAGAAVSATAVASAALGGPLGIAAISAGVLAIGLFKVWRSSQNLPGSFTRAKDALDALNQSLEDNLRLRAAVGTARERLGVARFDVGGAERDLQRAQERLANTQAQPGSLQFRFLQEQIRVAEENLTKATKRLTEAQVELDQAREKNRVSEQGVPALLQRTIKELQNYVAAQQRLANPAASFRTFQLTRALVAQGESYDKAAAKARALGQTEDQASGLGRRAVEAVISQYTKLGEKATGATRQIDASFVAIASSLNRLPTTKEISVIVRLAAQGQNVNQILKQLGILTGADTEQRRLGLGTAKGLNATLLEQAKILTGQLRTERKKLATINEELAKRRETARAATLERQAAQDAVTSAQESRTAAIEGLADAQRGLADAQLNLRDVIRESARAVADARQTLVDTIRQSKDAVAEAIRSAHDATNQSIQDAKGNLLDLNRSIAESIANFFDKTGGQSDKLSARMKALRQQIIRGGGGPETLRAAQEVNFNLQRESPVDSSKIKRQFDDLTDSFVRGRIGLVQFDKRFNTLTKGIDIGKFREMFGTAAANEFLDTLRASKQQAVLINEAPKRIGGAIAQQLVNPLHVVAQGEKAIAAARIQGAREIASSRRALGDALRQQTRNIKTAQQGLTDAVHAVTKAETEIVRSERQLAQNERRLRQAQHKETIANTAAHNLNSKRLKQLTEAIAPLKTALYELKPKPKGDRTREANQLRAGSAIGQ